MGIRINGECQKCHRTNTFMTPFEIEESIQVGCPRCKPIEYPQYTTEYNSGSNVWVIFKEYYKPLKSWFGFGPIKDYLVTEIIRVGGDTCESAPEMEFDTLKEAKEYIKKLENNN